MNEREELILKCEDCKFYQEETRAKDNESKHYYKCKLVSFIMSDSNWVIYDYPNKKADICPFSDTNFIAAYIRLREKVNNI